jgi:hypothetical protein
MSKEEGNASDGLGQEEEEAIINANDRFYVDPAGACWVNPFIYIFIFL